MTFILKKPWKIRDVSDSEYAKLADTSDGRRVRADSIEYEAANNWRWLIGTIVPFIISVLALAK